MDVGAAARRLKRKAADGCLSLLVRGSGFRCKRDVKRTWEKLQRRFYPFAWKG
ncbi:hypothetical protein I656_02548 [Geobacillus sp. WSUCF1]|nr:hypothetical protein I656_02548 [Geobacillus sp. WSUCF1]GAJ60047.1 hypothetical protein B23_3273 [Geobacillus thermoleovorans B23]